MNSSNPLGSFLVSRRSRVRPSDAGIPVFGPRRVPGLRREEVAELAGVSAVYYTRLEQGRARHPSDAVLDALARVLHLDATERAHLYDLTRRAAPSSGGVPVQGPAQRLGDQASSSAPRGGVGAGGTGDAPGGAVRDQVHRLLAAVSAVPAYVLDAAMDVLAANHLARALVTGLARASTGPPNLARHVFLDPEARALYPQWDDVARQTVAFLRFSAGRRPQDAHLAETVVGLSSRSPEFRDLWASQEVREKGYGTKRFRHPLIGCLELDYETMALAGDTDTTLVVFTAPDADAEEALRLLGSWTARSPRPAPPLPGSAAAGTPGGSTLSGHR
ncbi:helix-turn-helix transcriptional regulator [Streptomyces sp. NPDC058874]|uniref:helix-turn-helix transcriptional regulator n=1 Tax=unclassified Streptomyces TaxID=2593676 RepID=UPI0036ADAAFB